MTTHIHDPATRGGVPAPNSGSATSTAPARPRWFPPGLLIALIAAGLIVAGVVSLSTVLYAGLFGGMILMHTGGHRHGGQGGAAGRADHRRDATDDREDLRQGSPGSQASLARSVPELHERADSNPTTRESANHDQHGSHGCH